jgi:osmotically-inducible protein OsmY
MTDEDPPDSAETDRDLHQRVTSLLQQRGYASHQALQINVERGVVVVRGRLPTFYLRQIAIECIKRVASVRQVVDLIEVGDDPRSPKDHTERQPNLQSDQFPTSAKK